MAQQSRLCTLPLEIIDSIAFELTALTPLGPPSSLIPLLLTSQHLLSSLSSKTNPALYVRIFKHKFDVSAVERRAFKPSHVQCIEQMMYYCRAMKVLRRGDVYACPRRRAAPGEEADPIHDPSPDDVSGDDNDAQDAMAIAFMMMLEDDGRNSRQLVEWAHADVFAEKYVRERLYEGREGNDGWPVENEGNCCAMWLMWMLTTEEKLKNEHVVDRESMIQLLLPFVFVPYRYPSSEAPPNHYRLPLTQSQRSITLDNTIRTAHGPYPVHPPSRRVTSQVHFLSRPSFSTPLITPPAKLLYFSRRELIKFPIPPHLARDRAEAYARGNYEIGPTKEDVHEFNWGWTARPPGGRGIPKPPPRSMPDASGNHVLPPPPAGESDSDADIPPRWSGKAPHLIPGASAKSKKWDADWWRLRLCGNTTRRRPRIPYGKVYEPGCMDGLWQGRMLTPGEGEIQTLLSDPVHPPPQQFNETALFVMTRPMFMRLKEVHGVYGDDVCDHDHQCSCTSNSDTFGIGVGGGGHGGGAGNGGGGVFDDGMSNAWFPGETGSVDMYESRDEARAGKRAIVSIEGGRRARAEYRAWDGGKNPVESPSSEDDAEKEWEGYPHPPHQCPVCTTRETLRASLRREEQELENDERETRERVFAGVGLGLEGPPSSPATTASGSRSGSNSPAVFDLGLDEDGEEEGDTDTYEDDDRDADTEWDPIGETRNWFTANGRVYHASPPAHDKRKLAMGKCDGVREVLLFGETDERHGQAWNHYTFYGRVRPWDGLIGILRKPRNPVFGYIFFYGYLVGGENFVGNWRITSADPTAPVWESAFTMSRREDD